jgi:predicted dehydrogenase
MQGEVRVAILGCGEITRLGHLPAAAKYPGIQLVALVDSDVSRARLLGQQFRLDCQFSPDYKAVFPHVDAIINALPNSLHAPVNREALGQGLHVLCEKPLATIAQDARSCCVLAEEKGRLLAVGMNRRFVASHRLLPLVLGEQSLGELVEYDWSYGGIFDWQSASGFYFSRALAGGGALLDFGVHMLDTVMDWFGPVVQFDYQDDDWGSGIEANAILRVQHEGKFGRVKGQIRVSRTYPLSNRFLIRGTRAQAEIPSNSPDTVTVRRQIGSEDVAETICLPHLDPTDTFYKQLDNFIESIRGTQKLTCTGRDALRVIELIEQCYANRRRIPEPWSELATDAAPGPAGKSLSAAVMEAGGELR